MCIKAIKVNLEQFVRSNYTIPELYWSEKFQANKKQKDVCQVLSGKEAPTLFLALSQTFLQI